MLRFIEEETTEGMVSLMLFLKREKTCWLRE